MNILDYFNSPNCIRLVLSLVHFLWQGLAIALAVLLLNQLVGKRSSRLRYSIYMAGLFAMIVTVIITYSLIHAPTTPVPSITGAPGLESARSPIERPAITVAPENSLPGDNAVIAPPEPIAGGADTAETGEAADAGMFLHWQPYVPYVMLFYCCGVLLLLCRLIIGLQGGQRLYRASYPVDDPSILTVMARQARILGLSFTPALASCQRVIVPTVVGVLRPTILLPITIATGLNTDQIEMLLAHELAHIKRFDPLLNITQRIIEALLFFHPAVWFISSKIRLERENCCDDLVLQTGSTATAYAASLVEMAQQILIAASQSRLPVESLAAMTKPQQLRTRVLRLLGYSQDQNIRLKRTWLIVMILLMGVGCSIFMTSGREIPDQNQLTAVEIVRTVRESENWIHQVDTLYMQIESQWTVIASEISANRVKFDQRFFGRQPDPDQVKNMAPRSQSIIEYAFDSNRFRNFEDEPGAMRHLRIWDGQKYLAHEKYYDSVDEDYYIKDDFGRAAFEMLSISTAWPRSQPHSFWFDQKDVNELMYGYGYEKDFKITGKSDYRGTPCHVLEFTRSDNPKLTFRWYVGCEDLLLYGIVILGDGKKDTEFWNDDYQEVAPDCWMPMKQGYLYYEQDRNDQTYLKSYRNLTVQQVEINEKLADDLFIMEFKPGVNIHDSRPGKSRTYTNKISITSRDIDQNPATSGRIIDQILNQAESATSTGRIQTQTQNVKVFQGQFELDKDIPVALDLGKVYDWMLVSARSIRFEQNGADVNVHFKMDVRRGFEFNWRTRILLLDGEGRVLDQQMRDSRSGQIDFIYMTGQSPVEDMELKLLPFKGQETSGIERFRVYVEPLGPILDNLGREIDPADQDLIQGRILDPEGKPIADAVVKIAEDNMWGNDNTALVATDQQGRFKLKTVSWPYKFAVQWKENRPNEKWGRFQHLLLEKIYQGPQTVDIQFEKFPRGAAELVGQLTDQEGNPITAYPVVVSKSYKDQELLNTVGAQGKHLWWFTLVAEVSNEDGAFQLKNLPAGEYLIIPEPDSERYEWPWEEVILQKGQTTEKIISVPAKHIFYGRVLYEDGKPVYMPPPWPGAKTAITMWTEGVPMGRGIGSVDPDGFFKISLEEKWIENLKSGISYLSISVPNPKEEGSSKSVGKFPFDKLSRDKTTPGVFRIPR